MFNTDTTVPDWEKSPENHTENQENAEISQRAQAWTEAFPNNEAENPWLNANMEGQATQPAEATEELLDEAQPQDDLSTEMLTEQPMGVTPNPSQEEDAPNQLNSTDNIVANQMQEVWNNGNGVSCGGYPGGDI